MWMGTAGARVFNLGEISFLEKDWVEARCQFELALAQKAGIDDETRALLRYKILLTCLLDGNRAQARRMKAVLAASSDEPASYYAAAATAYQTGREGKAQRKIREAGKRFLPRDETSSTPSPSWSSAGKQRRPEPRGRISTSRRRKTRSPASSTRLAGTPRTRRWRFADRTLTSRWNISSKATRASPSLPTRRANRNAGRSPSTHCKPALAGQPTRRGLEFAAAQANLRKGDYRQARNRLERLFTSTPDAKSRAAELLRFETFSHPAAGKTKRSQAQTMMDRFPYTGATPALYYAEAAWAFKHGNNARGDDWIAAARKSYPPALNDLFASALRDVGWIEDFRATARAERRLSHVAGFIDPLIPRTG